MELLNSVIRATLDWPNGPILHDDTWALVKRSRAARSTREWGRGTFDGVIDLDCEVENALVNNERS